MYTGPANGGVCPLSELGQGSPGDPGYPFAGSCSIIATAKDFDGRTTRGHTDDYWISYLSAGPDPWETYGWTEHTWENCTADFMGTNQWKWDLDLDDIIEVNNDGFTILWTYTNNVKMYDFIPPATHGLPQTALAHGMRLFVESRGYNVSFSGGNYQVYTQRTDNDVSGGFSFADFKNEIDNGYPVMVQVEQHSMVGVGYDDSTNDIYIHDTWSNFVASMPWGGSYDGRELVAITVIHLDPLSNVPPSANFNYEPSVPIITDIIYFNSTSTDSDGSIVNWTWNLGDGNISYEENLTHQYSIPGTYSVSLNVTDDDGATDSITKIITVKLLRLNISLNQEWNLISLPMNESINKNDISVKYNGMNYTWQEAVNYNIVLDFIYVWNVDGQNYEITSKLEPGNGYWLYVYNSSDLLIASNNHYDDTYITMLYEEWNIIGIPFDNNVDKQNLEILYNSTFYSWENATTINNEEGEPLILSFFYSWNASNQNYETSEVLQSKKGYWIYTYYNCTLRKKDQYDNIIFSDNFDDGDISDWTITTAGIGVFETSVSTFVSSPYSLHMKSVNINDQAMGVSPIYDLNLSEEYNISFNFLVPSTNNHWFEVFNNNQTYLVINNDTQLRWYDGSNSYSIINLSTDQWYLIEIVTDPSSDTYDIYIDSDFKATCDMWIHTGFEDTFRIGDRNNDQGPYTDYGEAYWDDFIIKQN